MATNNQSPNTSIESPAEADRVAELLARKEELDRVRTFQSAQESQPDRRRTRERSPMTREKRQALAERMRYLCATRKRVQWPASS